MRDRKAIILVCGSHVDRRNNETSLSLITACVLTCIIWFLVLFLSHWEWIFVKFLWYYCILLLWWSLARFFNCLFKFDDSSYYYKLRQWYWKGTFILTFIFSKKKILALSQLYSPADGWWFLLVISIHVLLSHLLALNGT